ncbi:hypothetical protein EV421DRAFT_1743676 [Armillaria borealis]|uniref:Uncharacterized protein n=1 Tax=Armillaria borealis TaxID=47425 RepID=A0AA39IUR2_9AGAR|nr:hypothetical protein EV421DRAFT_1743676 [Armillaria borealis]
MVLVFVSIMEVPGPRLNKVVLDWDTAKSILSIPEDEELERIVMKNNWEVVHTFQPVISTDFVRPVVAPMKQIAPRSNLGLLFMGSETTSADALRMWCYSLVKYITIENSSGLDEFAEMILHGMQPTGDVLLVVDIMVDQMYYLTGERSLICVGVIHFDKGKNCYPILARRVCSLPKYLTHLARILERRPPYLTITRAIFLVSLAGPSSESSNRFFVATDERNTTVLEANQAKGRPLS